MSLPPRQHWIRGGAWPVVGETSPRRDHTPWRLELIDLQRHSVHWSLDELRQLDSIERAIDIHCVTRWSKPRVAFRGVRLQTLLAATVGETPCFVSFQARSERCHSSSLSLAAVQQTDPLVVWEAEGEPLAEAHGGPLRLVVPGKYFYKSVKWLERVELLGQDRLGFWESTAGYHNGADPWREERYIAANIARGLLRELLEQRDFSHRNLLGIVAAQRDLVGLRARHALLRNADFRGSRLVGADFSHANLSNSRFEQADLSGADFTGADVDGADFTDAILTDAVWAPLSQLGTTLPPC